MRDVATPGFVSLVDEVVDVVERRHRQLAEVLHVRPVQRVLPHAQVARVLWIEQITHVFTVDLHVAHLHSSDGISTSGHGGANNHAAVHCMGVKEMPPQLDTD